MISTDGIFTDMKFEFLLAEVSHDEVLNTFMVFYSLLKIYEYAFKE